MYYEVLYYIDKDNFKTKEFKRLKDAMAFYEANKANGFDWWITKRDKDGFIIDDIIY